MMKPELIIKKDFNFLLGFLPDGWRDMAKRTNALRRCRKVPDPETLLRVLLVHLAEGCSLKETSVRLKRGGIIDLSDVAIMDRLRDSGEWFRWMCTELMQKWIVCLPQAVYGKQWRVRVVDATRVKEPGPTGSSWCVHYCIDLPELCCTQMDVLDSKGSGETFRRFKAGAGDLLMGDRVYGVPPGIAHVLDSHADVLVRMGVDLLPLWSSGDARFDLLKHLRKLKGREVGDWDVVLKHGGKSYKGRVCALKKSRQATEKAIQHVKRAAQKHGGKVRPETLEAAGYVFVFTSVSRELLTSTKALEMYRGRWQVELVFKRLKSLIGFGHLRKKDPDGARAWLYGKLLIAFLIEALIRYGQAFSPWGYPVGKEEEWMPLRLAGGVAHVASGD